MPQIFQVLRCYKCLVFQVHQTKKSNKWDCKLCGEKQSIKRNYGIGMARDCRIHVQKLNSLRGEIDELKCSKMIKNPDSEDETEGFQPEKLSVDVRPILNSKWSTYVEDPEPIEEAGNDALHLGDSEIILQIPKKRRKQMTISSKNNHSEITSPVVIKSHTMSNNLNKIPFHTSESTSVTSLNKTSKVLPVVSKTLNLGIENTKPVTKKCLTLRQ